MLIYNEAIQKFNLLLFHVLEDSVTRTCTQYIYILNIGSPGHEPAVEFLHKTGQAHTVESVSWNA